MILNNNSRREEMTRPFCQATGCFEFADVYVVVKETEEPQSYCYTEINAGAGYQPKNIERIESKEEAIDFDGFKLILYLCHRHDNDFKYLVKGSELEISKRCSLLVSSIKKRVR